MGKVRTTSIKIVAREVIKQYENQLSPTDFEHNKEILGQVAIIRTKKFRNRIAGYITCQMASKAKALERFEE